MIQQELSSSGGCRIRCSGERRARKIRAKTSGQSDSQENSGLSAVEQNVKNMKKRLIVSLIFWIPLMYVSMGHMIYQWLNIPMPPFTMNFLHGNENAITYAFTQFLLLLANFDRKSEIF